MSYPQQQYGQPVYGQPQYAAAPAPAPVVVVTQAAPEKRSSLPTIAGVFLILAAINAMIVGGLVMAAASFVLGAEPAVYDTAAHDAWVKAGQSLGVCGGMYFMAFIFGLIATIFCFKRTKWMLTLIFTLLAMLFTLIGPFTFVFVFGTGVATVSAVTAVMGFLLGGGILFLISMILVLVAKKAFDLPPAQPMMMAQPTVVVQSAPQPQVVYQQPPPQQVVYQQAPPQQVVYQQPPPQQVVYQQPPPQ